MELEEAVKRAPSGCFRLVRKQRGKYIDEDVLYSAVAAINQAKKMGEDYYVVNCKGEVIFPK